MFSVLLTLWRLILPALIPSWRFFREVEDSPRIEVRLAQGGWKAVLPRPQRLSVAQSLAHLIYNARWNEYLFLISLADRFLSEPDARTLAQLKDRIALALGAVDAFEFRIRMVTPVESYIAYQDRSDGSAR